MGRKTKNVGGEKVANHGLRAGDSEPDKVSDWSASREGDAPERIDLRKFMTPVENQKQSNSCAANAVAGAYEYICKRYAMEKGDEAGDISRLFIYYVGRKKDQQRKGQANLAPKDEGMSISGAISVLQLKGACLEENWPFDLGCVNQKPSEACFDQAMDFKISEAVRVPVDLDTMKAVLAEGYPIVFGLKLTKAFFRPPASGLVKTPNPDDPKSAEHGLHAMLLVGYIERSQCFIVRNSWGEDWGKGGYVYLPYDYVASETYNFCGMYAIKGLSDVDLTPEDGKDDDGPDPEEEEEEEDFDDMEDEEDDDEEDAEDEDFDDSMFDRLAELRRIFARFDRDGSGSIDRNELWTCLWCYGIRCNGQQLDAYLEYYDADNSGRIGMKEFAAMCGVEWAE
mmetsp:Transcript_53848/g.128331  ORF Transcript_53848/g.128331 Transcript_53848/m.128331 type:complete len:396 (+) Transcript_53848:73-1260(+)